MPATPCEDVTQVTNKRIFQTHPPGYGGHLYHQHHCLPRLRNIIYLVDLFNFNEYMSIMVSTAHNATLVECGHVKENTH
jgi:hypothetical protein